MSNLEITQRHLKKILREFHTLCLDNNIKYSLSGGSMLGAIREKGFIPWDDDADVLITRQEYNKLLKVLPEEFNIINVLWVPRLVYKGNAKLEGGKSLDIFVIDNAPDTNFAHYIKVFCLKFLQGTLKEKIKWNDYGFLDKSLVLGSYGFGKLFSKKRKLKWYDKLAQWHNNKNTEYFG